MALTPHRSFMVLMYHEIGTLDRAPLDSSPGYLRYVVTRKEFAQQLGTIRASGLRGCSLGEMLSDQSHEAAIVLSFDDGCATDLLEAAPLLQDAKFNATFFVVADLVGRSGYLSKAGVQELAARGFEIGSHGRSHRFLTQLSQPDLEDELAGSKHELEAMTGGVIEHLSCPGGRWNRMVAESATRLGYRSVSTSRVARNGPNTDLTRLARIAVRRGASPDRFAQRCRGKGLIREQVRAGLLSGLRRILGDSRYDTLQRRLG